MKVFRELSIHGKPEQLARTAELVCNTISGDWSRDTEVEERARKWALPGQEHIYSFKRVKRDLHPAVNLFLNDEDKNTLVVTNIVPQEVGQLTHAEYNGIMEEFFRLFVEPAAIQTGAVAEIT
jgi:hypothetical protein